MSANLPDAEAHLWAFPGLSGPEGVVELVNALCALPQWGWHEVEAGDGNQVPPGLLVGLRYQRVGDPPSFVLGLGDFDPMPQTRRTPFIALSWRAGSPHPARAERETIAAIHLADVDYPVSRQRFEELWERTRVERRRVLGERENGPRRSEARAKVSFVLPLEYRSRLCPPRQEA